jgi:hypothetical protein
LPARLALGPVRSPLLPQLVKLRAGRIVPTQIPATCGGCDDRADLPGAVIVSSHF